MKTIKYTQKVRRGIPHLFKELLTDTDWGLTDLQHPMYRRLPTEEKRELLGLIQYLQQEGVVPEQNLEEPS